MADIIVSSGVTSTGIILNDPDRMYVLDGGVAIETTANEYSYMEVSSGGTANSTTVNKYGGIYVSSGGAANITVVRNGYFNLSGTANSTTLAEGGYLYVYPGATANKVTVDFGYLSVYRGGTATEIEWTPCVGSVWVENGAHATFASEYTGVYYGSRGEVLESAATMDDKAIGSGYLLYVMKGGVADIVNISSGGSMHVFSGGTANNAAVNFSGSLYVSSGGSASDTALDKYSYMGVFSGGIANNTIVNSGSFYVSGGVADGVTLNAGGELVIEDGGTADKVKINANGFLSVSGGCSAKVTEWTPGVGRVVVYGGGQVTFAGEYSGVYYGDGDQVISSAAEMNDIDLYANYYELYVMNGGKANCTTVDGGYMAVFSGGSADVVNVAAGGKLFVNNGGKAEHATIGEWGEVYVNSGGTANKTVVNNYGSFTVFGSADDVTVKSSGTVWVLDGGKVTSATVNNCGNMAVSGATVDSTTVNFGGELFIDETGKADHTTVNSGGSMYIYGGLADNTTISGGDVEVRSGGTMTKTKVTTGDTDDYWGSATVSSGGTAINTTVDFHGVFEIRGGASADIATVAAGGRIYIGEGATVTNITAVDGARLGLAVAPGTYAQGTYNKSAFEVKDGAISGYTVHSYGGLDVVSGGVATDITVTERAQVWVADGVLDGITMNGGYMYIANGGKVTGKMRFNGGDGDFISAYYGATVDFDLTRIAPGDEALVNDIFAITGYGTFTLTVDGMEKNGVYNLAGNAAYFEKTFTVTNTDGEALGTLTVGGEAQTFDDVTYQLARDGSILTLTVSGAPDLTGDLTGTFTLTDGMLAKKVNILPDAILHVSSGAVANKTTIHLVGEMYVYSGGVASNTTIQYAGGMLISSGGVASNTTVYGYFVVDNGGKAIDTTIGQDGFGGVVGVVSNTTVLAGGEWSVVEGGVASDTTVKAGGALYVSDGGKLTGKMTFEDGAIVSAPNGAIIDFDLAQTTMGAEEALVNNLSIVKGAPKYTLTVDGTQENGEYKLAEGASDFKKTITVVDISGEALGSLKVGGESVEGGGKKYTLAVSESSLIVTVGNATPPNGPLEPLNDYLYDKKKTPAVNANVTEAYGTYLNEAGQEVFLDQNGSIDHDGYHNRVGTDDEFDYAKIVLEHGAKLSFHAEATAAAIFTVYSFTENNGKYTLKKLQTLKLADKDKDGVFTADSAKQIQLQVSGDYYVSMQFKDKKAAEAYYNVTLNDSGKNPSEFYPLGDNSDDWGDMKTAGYGGAVGNLGVISAASLEADKTVIKNEWIGFGDKVDYKKFTLESAAELSLKVNAPDGPLKLTVCKLKETTKKDVTTYSQVNVKSVTVSAKQGTASLSSLQLEAGDYFFRVDSSDVKKSTGYSVQVTSSTFYTDGDNGWNNWLYNKKDNAVNELMGSYVGTYAETWIDFDYDVSHGDYYNFVGFGDTCDYSEIFVDEDGLYNFKIDTTGKAKFTVYSMTRNSKGVWTQKALGSLTISDVTGASGATLKKDVKLSATNDDLRYFVSMQAADTKKSPEVYYNVMSFPTGVSEADALSMPTDADALTMADASAFDKLAALDDASAWQSMLA